MTLCTLKELRFYLVKSRLHLHVMMLKCKYTLAIYIGNMFVRSFRCCPDKFIKILENEDEFGERLIYYKKIIVFVGFKLARIVGSRSITSNSRAVYPLNR